MRRATKSRLSFLVLLLCHAITSVEAETGEDVSQINYAYANYLGTGIYTAGEGTVQVYHMPFNYKLREPEQGKPGLKLRLPVTVGFANFETSDIVGGEFPEKAQTLTFVPGIGMSFRVYDNWTLSPFIDVGIGYDFENSNSSYVFGTGIHSLATFNFERHRLELFNGLLYAGNTVQPDEDINDFSRLETGLNFQFPLDKIVWNRKTAISTYYLNYIYFNDLDFLRYQQEPIEVSVQHEIGMTFDTFPDMKVLGIPFSRVGLGVRIGNKGEAIRLVFGTPY